MDKKAIYNLSYGVFMVSTKAGEVANGCITNTCIQYRHKLCVWE